jgi:hypothetical protein
LSRGGTDYSLREKLSNKAGGFGLGKIGWLDMILWWKKLCSIHPIFPERLRARERERP